MHDVQRVPKAESVMWLHKNERQLNSLKHCIGLTSFISMQENIFGSPEKQPQNFLYNVLLYRQFCWKMTHIHLKPKRHKAMQPHCPHIVFKVGDTDIFQCMKPKWIQTKTFYTPCSTHQRILLIALNKDV